MDVVDELRAACAQVARRARHLAIDVERLLGYAASLAPALAEQHDAAPDAEAHLVTGTDEDLAAFWLTLDAVNFGSGWFPTVRKRPGRSGYFTFAIGIREQFAQHGPWSAGELRGLDAAAVARALGQDSDHPLMEQYAASLRQLGTHVADEFGGRFADVATAGSGCSAVELAALLGSWDCFADVSDYGGIRVPFLKRAQIAAADMAAAGLYHPRDLDRLTIFADNLVPHVLRCDGVLRYDPALVVRIKRGELLEHGSPDEVEIRGCALHAVELIASALPGVSAADLDRTLWNRGQQPEYKARPRHRSRTTAY